MPGLLIKNVPDDLHQRLKQRAARHRRSMNGELLVLLEEALDDRAGATLADHVRGGGEAPDVRLEPGHLLVVRAGKREREVALPMPSPSTARNQASPVAVVSEFSSGVSQVSKPT